MVRDKISGKVKLFKSGVFLKYSILGISTLLTLCLFNCLKKSSILITRSADNDTLWV